MTRIALNVHGNPLEYVSPHFATDRHEWTEWSARTDLGAWCHHLNLSIHDRYEVQAALDRGDDMQQVAQGIIRRGC